MVSDVELEWSNALLVNFRNSLGSRVFKHIISAWTFLMYSFLVFETIVLYVLQTLGIHLVVLPWHCYCLKSNYVTSHTLLLTICVWNIFLVCEKTLYVSGSVLCLWFCLFKMYLYIFIYISLSLFCVTLWDLVFS